MRRRVIGLGAAAGVALATVIGLPAHAISATTADLYVLHGVPGVDVDVYVNGELTLDDFTYESLAGPLDLPAGDYEVIVTAADATDTSAPIIGPATVTLAAGVSYTAVAHLAADGTPTLTPYSNNITPTAAGQGRLTVRHDAAAPAVDILAGGTPVISGLVNPSEATLDLPVSTISTAVALAGTTDPVIGPVDLPIQDGVLTIVYAVGSAEDDTLALLTQTITVGHTSPSGVISGTAGYYAQQQAAQQAWTIGGVLAAGLGLGVVLLALRRRSAQRGDV